MKYSLLPTLFLILFISSVIVVGCSDISIISLRNIFKNREFFCAVIFSINTAMIATLFSLLIGVPVGLYLLKCKTFISYFLDSIIDIPVIIPPLIIGVLFLKFFNIKLLKEYYNFIFTFWGAVITQFFIAVPLTVKAAQNSFRMVPIIYEMTALTLGKKPLKAFWDTTFKIAFPGILSGLMLTWMRCLSEFGATLMVGGGIPYKTENIPINIYLNINSGDYEQGLSGSVIIILIAFFCILLTRILYSYHKKN